MPAPDPVSTLEFSGFTHLPVDFHAVLGATGTCTEWPLLSPFFNYYNTNHAEGPRKWYIGACPGDVVKVYLPAKGLISALRTEEAMREEHYNGENVLINVKVSVWVSPRIKVFYMHLTLRDEIRALVDDSPNGYVVQDAGTHIGYVYTPSDRVYTLDFGVEDLDKPSGQIQDSEHWLNTRVNPLDYFTDELRASILEAYRPAYDALVKAGTFPYSDLEDSRQNINEQNTIWGVWFKDDILEVSEGSMWSRVNLVKKTNLHQETYWRTLEQQPTMSGLFVEDTKEKLVGKALYEGQPIGVNRFYILSGNDAAGVARIEEDWGNNPPLVYLKYEVETKTDSPFDDKLIMESFETFEMAEASSFTDKAVAFRREPCKNPECA